MTLNIRSVLRKVVLSATLALSFGALNNHGWLNWLDTLSLRFSLALGMETSGTAAMPGTPTREGVQAILIGEEAFERTFFQESPLSRKIAADLIARIAAQEPRTIAIDFDLSPGPVGARSNEGQQALDDLLVDLARKGKTDLILVTPFSVADESILEQKYVWMQRLCRAGVRFAYPTIQLSQGIALRFSPEWMSLGVVAAGKDASRQPDVKEVPCELIEQGIDRSVFLMRVSDDQSVPSNASPGTMFPVDPDSLNQVILGAFHWSGDLQKNFSFIKKQAIVFLGAAYDQRDKVLTIYSLQSGVIFHAAAANTLRKPFTQVGNLSSFVFDWFLGILAAFIFHWGWSRYNQAHRDLAGSSQSLVYLYLRAKLWLIFNFSLVIVWVLLMFALGAWLLKIQIWANPDAMLLGIFVDALAASRSDAGQQYKAHQTSNNLTEDQGVSNHFVAWFDIALMVPIAMIALYFSNYGV
jgi:hypothetical protein